MGRSVTLKAAEIKLFISGKLYPECQSINLTIDYGENEIYGIDSQFSQELAPGRVSVKGTVSGVRAKLSGGLQGYQARTKISQILHSPYTSLRIKDRFSDRDILWLPQMKVTSENISIQAKGVVRLSFAFNGIIPYNALDLDG